MTTERSAIVTGGGSGIGLAISERLAADGIAVGILDRNGEAAGEAAAKITASGGTAMGVTADVTDRLSIDAAVAAVGAAFGRADDPREQRRPRRVLAVPEASALETWNRVLEVNLTGTFQCCQAVLPDMIEAGWGRIVNISSSSAQGGQPLMAHYVASKAGVIGLTKSLALEFGPKGITVNTIPPGFIDTPMLRASEAKGLLGAGVEHHEKLTPVRRVGRPEDIAGACARSSSARRPATSPVRSSGSTAAGTPEVARIAPLPPAEWPDGDAAQPSPPCDRPRLAPPLPAARRRSAEGPERPRHARPPSRARPGRSTPSTATCSSRRRSTPRQRELLVLRVAWRSAQCDLRVGAARRARGRRRASPPTRSTRIVDGPDAPRVGAARRRAARAPSTSSSATPRSRDATWAALADRARRAAAHGRSSSPSAPTTRLAMAFKSFGVRARRRPATETGFSLDEIPAIVGRERWTEEERTRWRTSPKPPEGTWTEHYPELGTAPGVLRELDLARVLRARARGDLQARLAERRAGRAAARATAATSPRSSRSRAPRSIVVRGMDGEVRAFHNVCRHRGNKLVWNDYPGEEIERHLPPVRLQVPRLAVRPRRRAAPSSSRRASSSTSTRPTTASCPVHCDVWAGVHLREPRRGAEPDAHASSSAR